METIPPIGDAGPCAPNVWWLEGLGVDHHRHYRKVRMTASSRRKTHGGDNEPRLAAHAVPILGDAAMRGEERRGEAHFLQIVALTIRLTPTAIEDN